jgi:sarcosine/dimethylglycine N-methyltransferase
MTDTLDPVADHYAAVGLTGRLKSALTMFGPEDQPLTVSQLSSLDQFHTRGLPATAELAELAGTAPGMSVLDIGSGIGGPARFIAEKYGCLVTGVDLSESFVEAAEYLTKRTGQSASVSFRAGSALGLPFENRSFDIVLLQHVAMNIADRSRLYREIRRVLKTDARLAIFDVVLTGGEPTYPLPWSSTPEGSFLLSADETRQAVELAGFRTVVWRDDTEAAKSWFDQMRAAGGPPSPNLGVVMGPDFGQVAGNLGRNLFEGRLGILTAVFEAQ